MHWLVWVLLAVILIAVFWTPLRRVFGRVQDEADSLSRGVAEGNPLATLGRGITENQKALEKRIDAIGQWDALVKTTSAEVAKTKGELEDIEQQINDRFTQHEEESKKPTPDKSLLSAIEEDVERLHNAEELKQDHLKTLTESLTTYERELKEREAELYEISDAIDQAKRVHEAGKVRKQLDDIESAARAAGKNVGIDGVGAATSLRELVNAVKRNEEARNSATQYRRTLTKSEGPKDPRLIARDRDQRIKSTFEKLRAARGQTG